MNPQQNREAERINRTILKRVRCMLQSSEMDKRFWGEAVTITSHLINLSHSSGINFEQPDTLWYGRVPDFVLLKPFGCRAYAHEKQGKLDSRALKCVFLCY